MPGEDEHESNHQRFLATLNTKLRPRSRRRSVLWDVSGITKWAKLFDVARMVFPGSPNLHVTLDGGTDKDLLLLQRVLSRESSESPFGVVYWWVPRMDHLHQEQGAEIRSREWPNLREFSLIDPERPAFRGGKHDIVVLFPPDELIDTPSSWKVYLARSWVTVAWAAHRERDDFIQEFRRQAEQRASQGRYSPWFFRTDNNGLLTNVSYPRRGIIKLPRPPNAH